ncbi:MAG: T9SS type A sorting domain-containing protein [Ignavibacteriaceae bacterium]
MRIKYLVSLFWFVIVFLLLSEFLPAQQTNLFTILPLSKDTIKASVIKENLLVNSLDGEFGAYQSNVQVAMSGTGTYAFCWEDYRSGTREIYYQFFDKFGNKISDNTKIYSYEQLANTSPTISANQNGIFIIAWAQSNGLIVAQKFNSYAEIIDLPSYLNEAIVDEISNLSIALNSDNSFVAVWNQRTSNNYNLIKSQFVYSSGGAAWDNLRTLNGSNSHYNYLSKINAVSVDGNGFFFVSWFSYLNDSSYIYLQKINPDGQLSGNRKIVSANPGFLDIKSPQISFVGNEIFLVAWEGLGSSQPNSFNYRLFNSFGAFTTEVLQSTSHAYSISLTSICTDHQGNFYIGYVMDNSGYTQKISSTGVLLTYPTRINYNSNYPLQKLTQDFSDVFDSSFIIAQDYDVSYDKNVGYCKISSDLVNKKGLTRINNDISNATQKKSTIKFNSNGEAIFVWQDNRNGKEELYAQVYDKNLNPINVNLKVTDSIYNFSTFDNIIIDSFIDGTFLIGFCGYNNYSYGTVFLQQISREGKRILSNVIVNSLSYSQDNKLSLRINSIDEALICWYNQNDVSYSIFSKSYALRKGPKSLKHSQNNLMFNPISVSVDTAFNIFIAWSNYDMNTYLYDNTIYGEFYNRYAELTENTFSIDLTHTYNPKLISKNDGKDFILIYNSINGNINITRRFQNQKDSLIYFKSSLTYYSYDSFLFNIIKFENKKSFVTYNYYDDFIGVYLNDAKRDNNFYLLSNTDNQYFYQSGFKYGIDLFEDKVLMSSEINNLQTGLDVYTTEVKVNKLVFNKEYFYMPVNSDVLYNNFPNPFNPTTKIAYELLSYHKVKLTVFDILGREVKVLVDEDQEKGLYEVDFDATSLASGVYFYKLEAFDTSIKKMILIK